MNPVLSFTNEDGSPLEDNKVKFHVKAGFESTRKIKVTNVHLEPIQISNPRPMHHQVSIVSYPTETLLPGQSGIVEINYNAPEGETRLTKGIAEFDVSIGVVQKE
jgi:uncharacterized membrane protein